MKQSELSFFLSFVFLSLILFSCSSSSKVSSTSTFQKRKYNKGWHINSLAKSSNIKAEQILAKSNKKKDATTLNTSENKAINFAENSSKTPAHKIETKQLDDYNSHEYNINDLSASSDKSSIIIPKPSSTLLNNTISLETKARESTRISPIEHQAIDVYPPSKPSSVFSILGFIISLLGLVLPFLPIPFNLWLLLLGYGVLSLGVTFSIIGLRKKSRRGFAYAGLGVSHASLAFWLVCTILYFSFMASG